MEPAASDRGMRGSAKGPEPPELSAWKTAQCRSGIPPVYGDLQQPERSATVNALFAEQTGQCVYCGRRIPLDQHQHFHVEHFRPQKTYPELQLDYTNLFLSCGPESEDGNRDTCGDHKKDWFEEDCHVPPAPETCAERFRFRSSGHIAGDGSPEADKMICKLNLNHPELVTERQVMIEALDREMNEGVLPELLRQGYMDEDRHGARPSFANVAIGYLRVRANAEPDAACIKRDDVEPG